jgi:hypothetical protein
MTAVCPNGHTSSTDDFCDVCGAPIDPTATPATAAATAAPVPPVPPTPPAPPTPPGAPPKLCPNCDAANSPDALFCEDCGYDFATGQLPPPPATVDPVSGRVVAAPSQATPARPPGVEWVAEIWVDPDWYASQGVSDPLPSVGAPAVVPLTDRTLLIGRTSTSRNIHPQIDVSMDSGVSRRHAQLTTDGQRWWVEDLQSSNGTYIGGAGEALPTTPLTPGQRIELEDDDRIYVGAWTRIVVRQS